MLCSKAGWIMSAEYTHKQGQYLAFIYYYTKIHRRPPSEQDIFLYFRVSPPSVHQMILRLEQNGLISRVPGQARSIKVLVPFEQLPPLE
jgi:Mn-dependent DtxR family transcriptional regulator